MNNRFLKYILPLMLTAAAVTSCKDIATGLNTNSFSGSLSTPDTRMMGITHPVKTYSRFHNNYEFNMRTGTETPYRLEGIGYAAFDSKNQLDQQSSVRMTHSPLAIRSSYRDGLSIKNVYFSDFKFKGDGGPMTEVTVRVVSSDGRIINGTMAVEYDSDNYITRCLEMYEAEQGTVLYQVRDTRFTWEAYGTGGHKRMLRRDETRDGRVFDAEVFEYGSGARENKEGVFVSSMVTSVQSQEVPYFWFYGFFGCPPGMLPSRGISGSGQYTTPIEFYYKEGSNGLLTRITERWMFEEEDGGYYDEHSDFTFY